MIFEGECSNTMKIKENGNHLQEGIFATTSFGMSTSQILNVQLPEKKRLKAGEEKKRRFWLPK